MTMRQYGLMINGIFAATTAYSSMSRFCDYYLEKHAAIQTFISQAPEITESAYQAAEEVAKGNFTLEEKYIYVQKENEEYRLLFYLKGTQLIVMKPNSVSRYGEAWLFTKVSDYGLSY